MSTYEDLIDTVPMLRRSKRLKALAEGVQLAIEANSAVRERPQQNVWLLWRNDQCLGVLGSYDRAWQELHDLMESIGGKWNAVEGSKHLRWGQVNPRLGITEAWIQPREVVG